MQPIALRRGATTARINPENGQLYSLRVGENELLHPGGGPDATAEQRGWWANSEIVMFPIVGPAAEGMRLPKGKTAQLPQHGISRYLPWTVAEQDERRAILEQRFAGGTLMTPKGEAEWPFAFTLTKMVAATPVGAQILLTITNDGDEEMRCMLGWHPSFIAEDDGMLLAGTEEIPLEALKELPGSVAYRELCAVAYTSGEKALTVESDLPRMMLWTRGGQFCIEPVSRFQDPEGLARLERPLLLAPGEQRRYTISIQIR